MELPIYVKDSLNPVVIDWFRVTDSLAVEFDSNIGRVNIACIYRSMSLSKAQNNAMTKMIAKLAVFNVESILVGDLNLPNVSWLSGTVNAVRLIAHFKKTRSICLILPHFTSSQLCLFWLPE